MLRAVRVLFRGHSAINVVSRVGAVHWIWRWMVLFLIFPFFFACMSLPPSFVFCLWSKWPTQFLLRNARSSDFLSNWPLRPLFLGSHLCIWSELMREWAFPSHWARPMELYFVLRSHPSHNIIGAYWLQWLKSDICFVLGHDLLQIDLIEFPLIVYLSNS